MKLMVTNILFLLKLTFQAPRQAAAALVRLNLPDNACWAALVLMAIVSALVMYGVSEPGPLFWVGVTAFDMGMTALLAYGVGRWCGGRGNLSDAVLIVVWLQLVLVATQMLFFVAIPPLAAMLKISLVATFLWLLTNVMIFLWLLTNFLAELHGFRSTARVLGGVLLTFVAMMLVMTMLLMPFFPAGA